MGLSTTADTLEEAGGGRAALLPLHPHLFVVLECDRPAAGGARHSLVDVDEVVIGRGSDRRAERDTSGGVRRLVVRIPSGWLSSTHARVALRDGRWELEDAGSKNGTFVNGVRVQKVRLHDGDLVGVGRAVLSFRGALPTPTRAPLDVDLGCDATATESLVPQVMAKLDELRRVAASTVPVLFVGETGTGKEVLARAVHEASGRSGDLVAVNCGALPAALVEGLLFGHVRGAISGAVKDEPGFVRAADRGTLFLDEIGDLPPGAQAALLRVLQEREVVSVGAVRPTKVDVRVVAATHRPLDELAERGEFRKDLFARLNGFLHRVPALRDRREDVGLLAGALLKRLVGARASATKLTPEAGLALVGYEWPANVRELEQCLARATAVAGDEPIDVTHLPEAIARERAVEPAAAELRLSESDRRLRDELVEKLREHGGNVSEVARAMKKARMQIQRWVKRFQLDPSAFKR